MGRRDSEHYEWMFAGLYRKFARSGMRLEHAFQSLNKKENSSETLLILLIWFSCSNLRPIMTAPEQSNFPTYCQSLPEALSCELCWLRPMTLNQRFLNIYTCRMTWEEKTRSHSIQCGLFILWCRLHMRGLKVIICHNYFAHNLCLLRKSDLKEALRLGAHAVEGKCSTILPYNAKNARDAGSTPREARKGSVSAPASVTMMESLRFWSMVRLKLAQKKMIAKGTSLCQILTGSGKVASSSSWLYTGTCSRRGTRIEYQVLWTSYWIYSKLLQDEFSW